MKGEIIMTKDSLLIKESFFRQKHIKLLRKRAGGDTYVIVYIKMLMFKRPHKDLTYSGSIEDIAKNLSEDIDERYQDVKDTIDLLYKMNMISIDNLNIVRSVNDD